MSSSAVGLVGLCAWPYTVDDAFIIGRFARNIASGRGYAFNPGHVADGVTGPAWLLPGVLAVRLGFDPVVAAKLCGLLCSMLATLWLAREQLRRAQGTFIAPLALLILACQPGLGGSGSSGLETGAATLATCVATTAALARPVARFRTLGAMVGLSAWLRPELAAVGLTLLLIAGMRGDARGVRRAWSLAIVGAVALCLFRWSMTGRFLPLAFSAKAGSLSDGIAYAARALLVMTGGFGVLLAVAGARWGQSRERALAALLLVHLGAVVLAGGDWMPGFRLFVPLLPQYAVLTAVGVVALWRRGRAARAAGMVAALAACALPLFDLWLRVPEWRAAGQSRERVGRAIAERLRAESERVALVDIGYLGYVSERAMIDLAGITEPEVATLPGGHLSKHVDARWLEARAPDALLLHSSLPPSAAADGRLLGLQGYPVELRVARMRWVQRAFRVVAVYEYAPHYFYALLRRAD